MFQPLVTLPSREIFGYEALSRFTDGRSPIAHLDDARERGELVDLELTLIESAVTICAAVSPRCLITVNASAATIADPRFARALSQSDRRWGLELSEHSAPHEDINVRAHLAGLDVLLLVDDAGVYHSTAERIRELRPDIVKIDREILWRAHETDDEDATVERLLEVSHEVGAESLVEGIESPSHERFARERGVSLGQGFLYGVPRPLPDNAA